jgi:signal transduction histidine kinase
MKHPALFRWPVIALTGLVLTYYTLALAKAPHLPFEARLLPNSELEIHTPISGGLALRPGDVLVAVDGWPAARNVDWRSLFGEIGDHELHIRRGAESLTLTATFDTAAGPEQFQRLLPLLAAWATAGLGALILALALPDNRLAWRTGYVFLSLAVAVAAFTALRFVPGSRLGFELLVPGAGVAFAELAVLTESGERRGWGRVGWATAYGGAMLLSLTGLVDILGLSPQGLSVATLTGLDLLRTQVFWGAVFLLANPLLLFWRWRSLPPSNEKQRARLLLAGTAFAVGPLAGLVFLRTLELIPPVRDWQWTLLALAGLAATYAYAIYRHRYLGLDLVVTRVLSLCGLAALTALGYVGLNALLRRGPFLMEPTPWLSIAFVVGAALISPIADQRLTAVLQRLLYGRTAQTPELSAVLGRLATSPDLDTLRAVFRGLLAGVNAGRGGLFLAGLDDDLRCVEAVRVAAQEFDLAEVQCVAHREQRGRARQRRPDELPSSAAWARVIVPIRANGRLCGLMVLGPNIPNDTYTGFQLAFLEQAAHALGLSAQTWQLFEASRELSRKILQVREAERFQLAARLHDEPLQQLAAVINRLDLRLLHWPAHADLNLQQDLRADQQLLRGVSAELRQLCAGLRPPALEAGLPQVVEGVAQRLRADQVDVCATLAVPPEAELPDAVTAAVYHILTEAANNVSKHAGASRVWLEARLTDGRLTCSLADDGYGIEVEALRLSDLIRTRHFGLVGMHDWALLIGGQLTIGRRPGGLGTLVQLTAPVDGHGARLSLH